MEQYKQENPLFELLYVLRGGKPQQSYLLHQVFQHFDQDPKLAKKLCQVILNYQNANQQNSEGLTPLHVAIKYNQILAIRYAQSDSHFDFSEGNLMNAAVTYCYFQIIEMLLIDEGLSIVEAQTRRANYSSATKQKILRRYEQIEIRMALRNSEDVFDQAEISINTVPQFPISKIPDKVSNENISEMLSYCSVSSLVVPVTKSIQTIQDKQIYHPNLLRCEKFVNSLLSAIFNFSNPQLDMVMLLILQHSRTDFIFHQIGDLIEKLEVAIPQKPVYQTFDMSLSIEKHCQLFGKSIQAWMLDYRQKLKNKLSKEDKSSLRKILSNKLQHDISFTGPNSEFSIQFHAQLQLYASLFSILKKPKIPNCTNLTTLQQFEVINQIDRRGAAQFSQTFISLLTQNQ